jgi:uncharacterized membrane protein SirB2
LLGILLILLKKYTSLTEIKSRLTTSIFLYSDDWVIDKLAFVSEYIVITAVNLNELKINFVFYLSSLFKHLISIVGKPWRSVHNDCFYRMILNF